MNFSKIFLKKQNVNTQGTVFLTKKVKPKCAFIIHPLSREHLWEHQLMSQFKNFGEMTQKMVEFTAARTPAFYYDKIKGIKSNLTGQEIACDLFCIPATPQQLLKMPEDFIYERLIEVTKRAHKMGAQIIGLGAYTKVIGDSGVTVEKNSPIPVTTGNSYSTATTLWAAREAIEKLGLCSKQKKAMIVGATGSIGRVSALILSQFYKEVYLVAPRMEKLQQLKKEVISHSPHVVVNCSVTPQFVSEIDFMVLATSSAKQTNSKSIVNVMDLKTGAVVCDCSRPFDISKEDASKRKDLTIIQSGEVLLPGNPNYNLTIGLKKPYVYACLAETALLTLEERFESFTLGRKLDAKQVKEIYKLGIKHGVSLAGENMVFS